MKLFYCRHIKRIPCSALDPSYFVLSVSCLLKKSLRARQLDNTTEGLIARGCYLCKQKPTLLKKKKKKIKWCERKQAEADLFKMNLGCYQTK